MKVITKIKLSNFKKFQDFEVNFDDEINILIGDNEAGKSSILLALDLVLSGSRSKIETVGIESLLNIDVVSKFLAGTKKITDLPSMYVEVYLNEQGNPDLFGRNNFDNIDCDGLRLDCEPIEEYSKEIQEILKQDRPNFPFEYYSIRFTTFADQPFTGYRRFLKHIIIDSSQINNEYATREYTKSIYSANADTAQKNRYQNEYRKHKSEFKDTVLADMNDKLEDYKFSLRTNSKSNLETDLVITEDDIPIENKGKGRQCFIKTEFALKKNAVENKIDALLLEEPENHLSHVSMKKLVQRIYQSEKKQLFIATHNNLICTRLDLRKAIMLNSSSAKPLLLKELPESTASFFIKAPDNNILEFVLSKKVILVEGDAEFILIDALYKTIVSDSTLEKDDVHVISVGGTSFKRYLDIAKILGIKTAIVRDNDKNHNKNCVENYNEYKADHIKVFSDIDNTRSTFEICLYQDNVAICDELFKPGRRTVSVQDYMLNNKADVAFELLSKKGEYLKSPSYIKEAIEWIRE